MDKCFLQVLTSGNIIAPFVRATSQERGVLGGRSQRDFKKGEDNRRVVLIKGGQVRVLLSFSGGSKGHLHSDGSSPEWLPATVLRLGNVLSVRQALDSLKGSDSRWKEGWSTDGRESAAMVALLKVDLSASKMLARASGCPVNGPQWWGQRHRVLCGAEGLFEDARRLPVGRGDNVSVVSCPYGLMSPRIFHSSVTHGIVSNLVAAADQAGVPVEENPALLLVDARSLPGSEGGAVLRQCQSRSKGKGEGCGWELLGMVTLPLQKAGATVDLANVIPAPRLMSRLITLITLI